MNIGYARVSTDDQKLDLQIQALQNNGCTKIYSDQGVSGFNFDRSGLDLVLKNLKPGDTLMVWRLDRLGRSLMHLVKLVDQLGKKGVHFHTLCENIDTTSSGGRLVFHIMAALAEFERSLISERTRAGMAAARNDGRHLGRRPLLTNEQLRDAALSIGAGDLALVDVAQIYGLEPRSLRRMIQNRLGDGQARKRFGIAEKSGLE